MLSFKAEKPVHLVLKNDRVPSIRKGHPWIYRDVLQSLPDAPAGSLAVLKDKSGQILAKGFYDPGSPLAFRVCALTQRLDSDLIEQRIVSAWQLRKRLFSSETNAYRLINGEGDGLPGLVCDIYDSTAVIKFDGNGPAGFYSANAFATWLTENLNADVCFLKLRSNEDTRGHALAGEIPSKPVVVLENGVKFFVDVVNGQKTGFFLDQRDNRQRIVPFARSSKVLNLFGYTGGFSVFAGLAGALEVTTVDIAKAALKSADDNWRLNGLQPSRHHIECSDCFDFLRQAVSAKLAWDLVIVDPPSFAPNQQSVDRAKSSYERLFTMAAMVTTPGGVLALSSCSSHIGSAVFSNVCESAIGKARRHAAVVGVHGQPADHPYPMACEELRYLKFSLYRLL